MEQPTCDIKTRLLVEYQESTEAYSKAVVDLARSVGKISRVEYEKLRFATELARTRAQESRNELETHTYEHRC